MMRQQKKAQSVEGLILGWLLLVMALLAFVQVVMRYLFHSGFSWGEEVNRYLCVVLTLGGAALGIEKGSHFTMDALYRVLPERVKPFLTTLIHLLSALIYAVVAGYGTVQIRRLYRFSSHSPALQIPMFIPYLVIPLGCSLMAWRCLYLACKRTAAPGDNLSVTGPDAIKSPNRNNKIS